MKRRQVITGLLAVAAGGFASRSRYDLGVAQRITDNNSPYLDANDIDPPFFDPISDRENRNFSAPPIAPIELTPSATLTTATHVAESPKINKNIDFDRDYDDDLLISPEDRLLLVSVSLRLKKLQSTVGYGNFNIINFDDALKFAKRFNQVGEFTLAEVNFIEKIFFNNAAEYGFYGEKVISVLTTPIKKQETFKVPHTGHYLFKDQSFTYYNKIRKSVGEGIVLTSGIRSNVKQLDLFLAKVIRVKGNLSRASRSLAPPGYSYHGVGDFDVGRKNWGMKNFTDAFSSTNEFKRMQDLGYVDIRYDKGNTLGVRFEPWHIKVV
ncbi:MAG: D-alanyl-D-alanine carboxypeptidase [Candidatus Endobugula sp.]|jgi:D-alanyl-D-alanine carboxypeptidase